MIGRQVGLVPAPTMRDQPSASGWQSPTWPRSTLPVGQDKNGALRSDRIRYTDSMSSLVRDFQRDIVQSSKSTTELLRTAKLVSAKLSLTDITAWVNAELSGYSGEMPVPDYRILSGGDLQVFNPLRGWQYVNHVTRKVTIGQPVSELEELAKGKSIVLPLHGELRYQLTDQIGGHVDFPQQIVLSTVQVKGLLDAVRDRLLDWSTELESRGILGQDMSFDDAERRSAHRQVFHIQNATGVFGNVTSSQVTIYDYSALHQVLKEHGVPQSERNELETVMDALKKVDPSTKAKLIDRAKVWITKNADLLGAGASIVRKALGLGE